MRSALGRRERDMLKSEDEGRLDSLAREFRAAFQRRLPHVDACEEFADRLVVTIPALHPETGAIVVWLDGDEVTVGIGKHFHCHFETYLDQGIPEAQRARLAAQRAVDFIALFMADAIVLRISRQRGRVVSAMTVAPTTLESSPGPNETDYLWSGPKERTR
jgi:hypothetical protein